VAKIFDLLGAGEELPQHREPPGWDRAKLAAVGAGTGTAALRAGANYCAPGFSVSSRRTGYIPGP
jgi:hypothetical protein